MNNIHLTANKSIASEAENRKGLCTQTTPDLTRFSPFCMERNNWRKWQYQSHILFQKDRARLHLTNSWHGKEIYTRQEVRTIVHYHCSPKYSLPLEKAIPVQEELFYKTVISISASIVHRDNCFVDQLTSVQFTKPLPFHERPLIAIAPTYHHLLKQKKPGGTMKDRLQNRIYKKQCFECKNITDCDTEPYHLLSTNVASGNLMDPNPVV